MTDWGPSGLYVQVIDWGLSGLYVQVTDWGPSGLYVQVTDWGPSGLCVLVTDWGPSGLYVQVTRLRSQWSLCPGDRLRSQWSLCPGDRLGSKWSLCPGDRLSGLYVQVTDWDPSGLYVQVTDWGSSRLYVQVTDQGTQFISNVSHYSFLRILLVCGFPDDRSYALPWKVPAWPTEKEQCFDVPYNGKHVRFSCATVTFITYSVVTMRSVGHNTITQRVMACLQHWPHHSAAGGKVNLKVMVVDAKPVTLQVTLKRTSEWTSIVGLYVCKWKWPCTEGRYETRFYGQRKFASRSICSVLKGYFVEIPLFYFLF